MSLFHFSTFAFILILLIRMDRLEDRVKKLENSTLKKYNPKENNNQWKPNQHQPRQDGER